MDAPPQIIATLITALKTLDKKVCKKNTCIWVWYGFGEIPPDTDIQIYSLNCPSVQQGNYQGEGSVAVAVCIWDTWHRCPKILNKDNTQHITPNIFTINQCHLQQNEYIIDKKWTNTIFLPWT